jgi:hypothetical protein
LKEKVPTLNTKKKSLLQKLLNKRSAPDASSQKAKE